MKLPYCKARKGRLYFELGKDRAEAVGMAASIPLGPDGADAWAKGAALYEDYQKRLRGEQAAAAEEDRHGGYPAGSLGAFYVAWKKTDDFAVDKKPRTQEEYDHNWERRIAPAFGRTQINRLTVSDSEAFHRRMRKELSPREAWSTLKTWRVLLTVLEKKHILPKAPIGAVTNPMPVGRNQFWLNRDVSRLLRACRLAERFAADAGDKRVWRAMGLTIRMAWETAMSPPDVRTFTLSMMKRDREGFYIERPRTKTQKQTQPIISDQLAEDLLAYEKALTAAGVEILKTAPLFRSKRGQPWDRDFLAHRFAELRRAAFGPDEKRQFQDLRRSANLEADLGGASAEDRAKVMANALDRNPMLDATYTPATVAAGRKVRSAREAGRQLLDQELGRKTK